MNERPPLDSFFRGSKEINEFPPLNPSRGVSPSQTAQLPLPQQQKPIPEMEAIEAPSSFLGKTKEALVGIGKGVGSTALDIARLASKSKIAPLGVNLNVESNPYVQQAFERAESVLQAEPGIQQTAKSTEQLAEIFLPFLGLGAKAVTKMPSIARSLEETSMRLTPTMKRDLGVKVQQVSDWMVKNGITGSPEKRLDKVSEIYETTETVLSKFLKEYNTTKGFFVPKTTLIKDLKALKGEPIFRDSRDYETIVKQIDDAIANVNAIFKRERIPLDRFNNYKRSIFSSAFNKAGTKVLDDVEFAIGDVAKYLLEKSMRGLKIAGKNIEDFNKEYSTVINARKILREAENKSQIGNWGKVVSALLGAGLGSVGGPAGAVMGGAAGPMLAPTIAGTAVRSNLGQFAEAIGTLSPVAKKALATLLLGGGAVSISRLERLFGGLPQKEIEEVPPQVPLEERPSLDTFINDK